MKAGFAEIDFTPLEGFMPGEGVPFWARGAARCPLYANVAALSDGKETVILISADQLKFGKEYADDMRARISAKTGVPASHILIAATHTHTGATLHEDNSGPGNPELADYTNNQIVKCAIGAYEKMADGYVAGTAKGEEKRMSFNRDCILKDGSIRSIPGKANKDNIVGYLGEVDYDVHVMRVDNKNGDPACFIVNYANHPDNDNTKRTHFSADFPGYLRENLKRFFGKDVVVLFLNGACGDVNAYNYKSGVSEKYASGTTYMPEEMGKLLTETVLAINKEIKTAEVDTVKAVSSTDTYNRRKPANWETEHALAVKARKDAGERLYTGERNIMLRTLNVNPADTVDMELQGARVGDWYILGVPGELYTEIGLAIKALEPERKVLISEQTGGALGYIPPDSVLGTTAYGGRYYAGELGYGTKDKMVAVAKELIAELG